MNPAIAEYVADLAEALNDLALPAREREALTVELARLRQTFNF